nr:MAG TPA: hypothetical protein [Bacteriophage sp.]
MQHRRADRVDAQSHTNKHARRITKGRLNISDGLL